MAGSTFGNIFTVTTWGESHGSALGVVIDGCPAGLEFSTEDIQHFLNRRRPGQNKYTTKRQETDTAEILSGVFEGYTTGTPISILIRNEDHRSMDYSQIKDCYRPGHADYTYDVKYGIRDYRGGGRSSGRETIGRVAAGAVAAKLLDKLGISLTAYTSSIGKITVPSEEYNYAEINENVLYMPNNIYADQASSYLEECIRNQDSSGGIIECLVQGLPAGLGQPVFQKLDAALSAAVMSIGGIKGVEIGDGFAAASSTGSQNNDCFYAENGSVRKSSNHSGGILGGISDGSPLLLRAAVKPTPSIGQVQDTVNSALENTTVAITGRHDPVIVPRAVVVVESMVAITLVDALLMNMGSKLDYLKKIYE